MPLITKGPFYIESYKVDAYDYGDRPYADIVIGHPDGFKIVVKIETMIFKKDKVSIYTEWP